MKNELILKIVVTSFLKISNIKELSMKNEISKPISTRISLEEFAKVLDSLIAKGLPAESFTTNSSIIKTAMRLTIANSPNPTAPATQTSIDTIKQLWRIV